VFTASGSPATIAGVTTALRILQTDATLKPRLWDNVRRVRIGLASAGFTIGATESPIVPIVVGAPDTTVAMRRAPSPGRLRTRAARVPG
jgi:7-keto-8-aminopelargonate synthetase-like enzyme